MVEGILSMLVLLLAQVLIAQVPPVPRIYASPPIVSRPDAVAHRNAAARERIAVSVVVRVPQGVLWSGNLWVGGIRGASWRQSENEALGPECALVDQPFGTAQRETSVTLRRSVRQTDAPDMLTVDARWTRPSQAGCGGTSTVELRQSLALAPGATQTLKGDGGLIVELRRR
jgi:hypothetical protein